MDLTCGITTNNGHMHTHTHMTVELTMSSRKLLHDLIMAVVCVTVFMAYDTTIHAHTHT